MPIDPEIRARLLTVFKSDLEEQAQLITSALLMLESKELQGEERFAQVKALLRSSHNIKGTGTSVGLEEVSSLAHSLEDKFKEIESAEEKLCSEFVSFAFFCMDSMKEILQFEENNTPHELNVEEIIAKLQSLRVFAIKSNSKARIDALEDDSEVRAKAQQHSAKVDVACDKDIDCSDCTSASESQCVETEKYKNIARRSANSESVRLSFDKITQLNGVSEEIQISKIELENHVSRLMSLNEKIRNLSFNHLNHPEFGAFSLHHFDQTSLLEEVKQESDNLLLDLGSSSKYLNSLANNLEGNVRQLRLVPVSTLLSPLTRSVRDIAHKMKKEVSVSIIGGDTEIDRVVMESLNDPILHLLRNAIDHGIEAPEEREHCGKDRAGTINIIVVRKGSRIVVEIQDDGKGIDIEKIKRTAIKRGMYSAAQLKHFNDQEVKELIFVPTFSSCDQVTDLSGRGVGLDVVKDTLQRFNGDVSLSSVEGTGTSFQLEVPIMLSTERGLLVEVDEETYAVPSQFIERVMDIPTADTQEMAGSLSYAYLDRAVPLRSLGSVLSTSKAEMLTRKTMPVVIVERAGKRVGLIVDEILGEREIIVKPLQFPIRQLKNISGGALMGSGDTIMVLSVDGVIENALDCAHSISLDQSRFEEEKHSSKILVVDDSITTRTLEQTILESAGYEVQVSVNGMQAWERLQGESFDLVVTDVEMPVMDGFELTKKIKQNDHFKHIPVVMVSSLAEDVDINQGLDAGANAYIAKGQFQTDTLIQAVEDQLLVSGPVSPH